MTRQGKSTPVRHCRKSFILNHLRLNKVEAGGIEPPSNNSQLDMLQQLTSSQDPVAAYLQLLGDTQGHLLAQTELDLAYVLTRWVQLPQHIRQTIMTLVRSTDVTPFDR